MKNSTQQFFRRFTSCIFWAIGIFVILLLVLRVSSTYIPKHWFSESAAELERIRKELPLAETRWKSHNIVDYEIDADGVAHPAFCGRYDEENNSFSPWHLKISEGQIIFDNDQQKRDLEVCAISDFLPPKVFDTLRQKLEQAEPKSQYLKIEFDPKYGFVSDYYLTSNSRVSDLLVHYAFSNFRPKQP